MVHIGFMLVESGSAGRISVLNDGRTVDPAGSGSQSLGVDVLTAAFEAHAMARDEVRIYQRRIRPMLWMVSQEPIPS